ncbi:RagB/SusD family nutrient uptake outer membrane protein [Nonlabens ulvanivorans]|uniref:RagB/SusD family nutrient uptake outer membrane protein n=1 Tax=Nonlabens ulvanivorans TaxID=906888 RepID=UPI00294390C8|nr:RagB/SusD family nutrient uptake outer membrane protein [Nonlabens ulvanivorans]WOI21712.1 RagB/SusD family nutrient uptake outer membrane protein [Nonlabens ulvanivorans]
MKKIKLIALLFIAILASCDDATEIVQPGEFLGENAFQNVDDLQTGLFGAYSQLSNATIISFTSIFTDEVSIGRSNGGQGITNDAVHLYNLNPNTGEAGTIWLNNYTLINFANRILEAAENITPESGEEDTYNKVRAEALALRAFGHSQLLSFYAEDITDPSSTGVIAIDFVPELTTTLPRNTVGETMTLITNDLNEAELLFSGLSTPVSNSSRIFIDTDFVRAVRGRMALYTEDYVTAEIMADALIASYNITDRTNFAAVWQDQSVNGVIFKADRTDNNAGIGSVWNTNNSTAGGSPVYELSRSVFNKLENNPGDIRRTVYVDPTSIVDPNYASSVDPRNTDVLVIDKYPGDPNLTSVVINDLKIFRVEEFRFIKAECRIFNNDLPGAAAEIKAIRDQRYSSAITLPSYTDAQEAWADVLEERRLELYLEGHRYLDVSRLASKANLNTYDRDATDCSMINQSNCNLSTTLTIAKYFPIPFDEISGNNAISQSTGY